MKRSTLTKQVSVLIKACPTTAEEDAKHVAAHVWNEAHKRGKDNPAMISDLIQEGLLGVIRATELYDANREDSNFPTYAFHWIRAKIRDYHRAYAREVQVFRGRKGRKVYSGATEGDARHLPLLHDDDSRAYTPWDHVNPIPDPERLCIAKQQAERVRGHAKRLKSERERLIWRTLCDDTQSMAQLARQLGVSRQLISALSHKLHARAQIALRDLR